MQPSPILVLYTSIKTKLLEYTYDLQRGYGIIPYPFFYFFLTLHTKNDNLYKNKMGYLYYIILFSRLNFINLK